MSLQIRKDHLERNSQFQPAPRQSMKKHSPNILIVEDDADMAALTHMLINRYSEANIFWAEDSYAALDALYENYFDYVIVDQFLPGLRGLQVLSEIDKAIDHDPVLSEQTGARAPTRVLFMSGAPIEIPEDYKLRHFIIQDAFPKNSLNSGIARNLAS